MLIFLSKKHTTNERVSSHWYKHNDIPIFTHEIDLASNCLWIKMGEEGSRTASMDKINEGWRQSVFRKDRCSRELVKVTFNLRVFLNSAEAKDPPILNGKVCHPDGSPFSKRRNVPKTYRPSIVLDKKGFVRMVVVEFKPQSTADFMVEQKMRNEIMASRCDPTRDNLFPKVYVANYTKFSTESPCLVNVMHTKAFPSLVLAINFSNNLFDGDSKVIWLDIFKIDIRSGETPVIFQACRDGFSPPKDVLTLEKEREEKQRLLARQKTAMIEEEIRRIQREAQLAEEECGFIATEVQDLQRDAQLESPLPSAAERGVPFEGEGTVAAEMKRISHRRDKLRKLQEEIRGLEKEGVDPRNPVVIEKQRVADEIHEYLMAIEEVKKAKDEKRRAKQDLINAERERRMAE
jgi:hypothetical protein